MNRIDTSTITALHQMPWKAASLAFVQDNVEEGVYSIVKAYINSSISAGVNNQASPTASWGQRLTYSDTVPYILWGGGYTFSTTGTLGTFSISPGSVFYNGTMYEISAQSFTFTATSSSYIAASATFSYDLVADPTTFSDLIPENIHKNYVINFSAQSGTFVTGSYPWYYKPATNGSLQNIGQWLDWQDGGTTFTMIGGSYTAGDVNFNRFKIINNTLHWHLQLRAYTQTSTSVLTIYMPPAIKAVYGKSWYSHLTNTTCILNASSTAVVARMETLNGGINYVNIYPISGSLATGTNDKDVDIFLTGELF